MRPLQLPAVRASTPPGRPARARRMIATWRFGGSEARGRCPQRNGRVARFSASGICLARIAANFSAVMPGRARTRARCTAGRGDDEDGVAAPLAAGLEQERDVEHRDRRARRDRGGEERVSLGAHQRMHDRLELASGAPGRRAPRRRAPRGRRPRPRRCPGNAFAISGAARAAIEPCTAASASWTGTPSAAEASPRSPTCPCRSSR